VDYFNQLEAPNSLVHSSTFENIVCDAANGYAFEMFVYEQVQRLDLHD